MSSAPVLARKEVAMFGLAWPKEVLEVLLVPFSIALLTILWPWWQAHRKRRRFAQLTRRELDEAKPYRPKEMFGETLWHQHLTRHFLHQEIIAHPADSSDFTLSLNPGLSYHLNQMWIAHDAAGKTTDKEQSRYLAGEWCWHLRKTCQYFDRWKPFGKLKREVWEPWMDVIERYYPGLRKKVAFG
jgi:hypothetical protein